jgi:hypothetical protein
MPVKHFDAKDLLLNLLRGARQRRFYQTAEESGELGKTLEAVRSHQIFEVLQP